MLLAYKGEVLSIVVNTGDDLNMLTPCTVVTDCFANEPEIINLPSVALPKLYIVNFKLI